MWSNIFLAFLEGLGIIVSPCILPILPLMLSTSLTGSKLKPLAIILGFILVFTLFTLFARQLIIFLHINQDILRNIAFILLICLGLIMLSDTLSEKFNLFTSQIATFGDKFATHSHSKSDFISGLSIGSLLGFVWTPCAGPILAAVLVQVVIQKTNLLAFLTLLSFAIGVSIPMLIIIFFSRQLFFYFDLLKSHTNLIRKILGFVIIASVLFFYFSPLETTATSSTKTTQPLLKKPSGLINGLSQPYPAPEINGITAWINSSPLTFEQLRGKVVLIDFWTYSCINCIRTLPYLKDWYEKYHKQGLVLIGIHSPEFQFEQDLDNVRAAVTKFGILYPVALDNHFVTWQNFQNRYWPAHFLIDRGGNVVYEHFGEGEYETTENNIRYLLGITGQVQSKQETELPFSNSQTPETYFGYRRIENNVNLEILNDTPYDYSAPQTLDNNQWALQGKWEVSAEKITSKSANASLKMHFTAKNVYAVMGATTPPIEIEIKFRTSKTNLIVNRNQLYTLISFPVVNSGTIEIIAKKPGLEIYTFTFGS